MAEGPIRRGQLVTPFGVGALSTTRNGTSVVTAGLDHWFPQDGKDVDPDEFRVDEWRLQRIMQVDHLRLPPDFRRKVGFGAPTNCYLFVPVLRFPRWHVCPSCRQLTQLELQQPGRQECEKCRARLVQVDLIAACPDGHMQDFPWREWVHQTVNPTCAGRLKLVTSGGATLAASRVKCGECGADRSLSHVMSANADETTYLSKHVSEDGEPYLCRGHRPWLGSISGTNCSRHLRGVMRSASNAYYSQVVSAIYIPRSPEDRVEEVLEILTGPLAETMRAFRAIGQMPPAAALKEGSPQKLTGYSDSEITKALRLHWSSFSGYDVESSASISQAQEPSERPIRRDEYKVLLASQSRKELVVKKASLDDYDRDFTARFSSLMLVERLRETRVFGGFSRIYPRRRLAREDRNRLLWRNAPSYRESWLPAYVVLGEGLFFAFKEELLRAWENTQAVVDRIERLQRNYGEAGGRRLPAMQQLGDLDARFVMLHTFAHTMINRLAFECGYSTASLRERLYCCSDDVTPMAGVLIYTAVGDADGTMGGLVRMGKPGRIEMVFRRALEGACWCSSDPVCMEVGSGRGQGPYACNLAACHNCALLPETSCESFNAFLDRGLLVGDTQAAGLGFFEELVVSPT